jgi:hypothetical protein
MYRRKSASPVRNVLSATEVQITSSEECNYQMSICISLQACFCCTVCHRNEKVQNTGLFVSPSGISDLCGTVTGMVTPKGSMATVGESLQVPVLPYKCSICPPLVTRQMSNLVILANSKTQNGFLFRPRHVLSQLPLSDKTCKYATAPSTQKKTWRDSLLIYMLLSAVSVLVVAWRSSEVPEGLTNNPVQQERPCTYNVISRCVRATIAAAEKQWVLHRLRVCVCSLRYPACILSSACPAPLYKIFSTLPHEQHDFLGRGIIEHKMCISSFSTTFVWNIFHSKKNWVRYDTKCISVFM